MPTLQDIQSWRGHDVVGPDGDKVGKVEDIYLDRETEQPEWAAVKTGLFGNKLHFVPIDAAQLEGETIRVPYDKNMIKDAPKIDPDGDLSPEEERELYRYYDRDYREVPAGVGTTETTGTTADYDPGTMGTTGMQSAGVSPTERATFGGGSAIDEGVDERAGAPRVTDDVRGTAGVTDDVRGTAGVTDDVRDREARERTTTGAVGRDTSGPTTDDAMTRSEEELRVGKTQRETGRARLRKYIVSEDVHTTVPVQREEARIEREPITDANIGSATSGPELSEEEHEVTLHAEDPVVEKRVVPKERVRLDKDTVTEERQVDDQVRKEQIEVDNDSDVGRRDVR